MSLTINVCRRCGKENRVPDRYHGRTLKCPGCGETFSVEAAATPPAVPPAAALPAAAPPAATGVPAAAGTASAAGPTGLGGWLAVFIGWLTVMAAYTLYQFLVIRDALMDSTTVENLRRLQMGEALEYARTAETINGFLVLVLVIAILAILTARRIARPVVVTVLVINLGLGVWEYIYVTEIFDASTREALQIRPEFMAGYLSGRVAACSIGIAYMLRSKRVKNTLK